MGTERSVSGGAALPAPLATAAVLVGLVLMFMAAALTSGALGVRAALVVAEIGLMTPALGALAFLGAPVGRSLALQSPGPRTALLSLAAGATLWGASLGLFELQYVVWKPPEGYLEAFRRLHEALKPDGPIDAAFSVAAIALVPALCEEVLFRGAVLPSFLKTAGPAGAVCFSALLFGSIHLDFTAGAPVLYRVPFAFAVGLGLGALRLWTGSLVPPMLAHATLNTITFVVAPFVDDPNAPAESRPLLGAALLVAGGLFTALVFRAMRRR
jgi:membrane protease YdiL (CAAX protease family)